MPENISSNKEEEKHSLNEAHTVLSNEAQEIVRKLGNLLTFEKEKDFALSTKDLNNRVGILYQQVGLSIAPQVENLIPLTEKSFREELDKIQADVVSWLTYYEKTTQQFGEIPVFGQLRQEFLQLQEEIQEQFPHYQAEKAPSKKNSSRLFKKAMHIALILASVIGVREALQRRSGEEVPDSGKIIEQEVSEPHQLDPLAQENLTLDPSIQQTPASVSESELVSEAASTLESVPVPTSESQSASESIPVERRENQEIYDQMTMYIRMRQVDLVQEYNALFSTNYELEEFESALTEELLVVDLESLPEDRKNIYVRYLTLNGVSQVWNREFPEGTFYPFDNLPFTMNQVKNRLLLIQLFGTSGQLDNYPRGLWTREAGQSSEFLQDSHALDFRLTAEALFQQYAENYEIISRNTGTYGERRALSQEEEFNLLMETLYPGDHILDTTLGVIAYNNLQHPSGATQIANYHLDVLFRSNEENPELSVRKMQLAELFVDSTFTPSSAQAYLETSARAPVYISTTPERQHYQYLNERGIVPANIWFMHPLESGQVRIFSRTPEIVLISSGRDYILASDASKQLAQNFLWEYADPGTSPPTRFSLEDRLWNMRTLQDLGESESPSPHVVAAPPLPTAIPETASSSGLEVESTSLEEESAEVVITRFAEFLEEQEEQLVPYNDSLTSITTVEELKQYFVREANTGRLRVSSNPTYARLRIIEACRNLLGIDRSEPLLGQDLDEIQTSKDLRNYLLMILTAGEFGILLDGIRTEQIGDIHEVQYYDQTSLEGRLALEWVARFYAFRSNILLQQNSPLYVQDGRLTEEGEFEALIGTLEYSQALLQMSGLWGEELLQDRAQPVRTMLAHLNQTGADGRNDLQEIQKALDYLLGDYQESIGPFAYGGEQLQELVPRHVYNYFPGDWEYDGYNEMLQSGVWDTSVLYLKKVGNSIFVMSSPLNAGMGTVTEAVRLAQLRRLYFPESESEVMASLQDIPINTVFLTHKNESLQDVLLETMPSEWQGLTIADLNQNNFRGSGQVLERDPRITSSFGIERTDGSHRGLDLAATGDEVLVPYEGWTVVYRGWDDVTRSNFGLGYMVVLEAPNSVELNGEKYKLYILFGHLDEAETEQIDLPLGTVLQDGEVVGISGNTGASSGPHLHYEIRLVAESANIQSTASPEGRGLSFDIGTRGDSGLHINPEVLLAQSEAELVE